MYKIQVEKIELVIFVSSLFSVILSYIYLFGTITIEFKDETVFCYIVIVICLVFELIKKTLKAFLLTTLIHIIFTVLLLALIGSYSPLIEMVFMSIIILNLTLRMNYPLSLIAVISIISYQIFYQYSRTIQHDSYMYNFIICIEIYSYALCQLVIHYREKLVKSVKTITQQAESLKNLELASESFIEYLSEMREESAEKERLRITRELHDSLGYTLTNIVMMMNAVPYLMQHDQDNVLDFCSNTKELASNTLEETRDTLYLLRTIAKDIPSNPGIALIRLCNEFQSATEVNIECITGNLPNILPEHIYHTIFRAIQVGLINALKHSNTNHIRIYFWLDEKVLRMTIWNNSDLDEARNCYIDEGIGLNGVRERLATINGQLHKKFVQDGFELIISIPTKEIVSE